MKWKFEYEYCPVNYITSYCKSWLSLYSIWKKGFLLEPGGIGDQPAKYVDVMQFVDALFNQHEREMMEQMKSKQATPKTNAVKGRLR